MKKAFIGFLIAVVAIGLSWLITSGIVWLIFRCFDLQFSWKVSTGIWLLLAVLRSVFKRKHD